MNTLKCKKVMNNFVFICDVLIKKFTIVPSYWNTTKETYYKNSMERTYLIWGDVLMAALLTLKTET
jgi:hypothetical protein